MPASRPLTAPPRQLPAPRNPARRDGAGGAGSGARSAGPAPRALGETRRGGSSSQTAQRPDGPTGLRPGSPTVSHLAEGGRWPRSSQRTRNGVQEGRRIVLTNVTDDHWMTSSQGTQAGSGKRRADARLPEQTRRRHPAHARGQTPAEAPDQGTPVYTQLAAEWAARGATVPCRPDPLWQRLASPEHLRHETESTLRQLHLEGNTHPADRTPQLAQPEAPRRAGR